MGEGQSKKQAADAARTQMELKEAQRRLREQAAESERKQREQAAESERKKREQAEVEKQKAAEKKKEMETLLDEPWRMNKRNGWNYEEVLAMREEIAGYVIPDKSGIENFNVLLLGTPTSGKTSLRNTVGSAFEDKVLKLALAGEAGASMTKMLKCYPIRAKTEGTTSTVRSKMDVGINLWDTKGLDDDLHTDTICKIIDGKVQHNTNLENNLEDVVTRTESEIGIKDKMHCILFIVNGLKCVSLGEGDNLLKKIKEITAEAEERGLPTLLVLTHVDRCCQHVGKDTNTVFKSPRIRDLVERDAVSVTGFPANKIHPIRNYTKELIKDPAIDFLSLLLMTQVMECCDEYCEYLAYNLQHY